jgi:DNA-binding transcriptional MerR regulator
MRSGQLARLAGISADTLRHYERLGLLEAPLRTTANYRVYPPEAARRLRLIRNALAMGFSLKEIGRILKVRQKGGAPCREVRRLAEEKIALLGRRIEDLIGYRHALRQVLTEWDARLDRVPQAARAQLLEELAKPPKRPAFSLIRREQKR